MGDSRDRSDGRDADSHGRHSWDRRDGSDRRDADLHGRDRWDRWDGSDRRDADSHGRHRWDWRNGGNWWNAHSHWGDGADWAASARSRASAGTAARPRRSEVGSRPEWNWLSNWGGLTVELGGHGHRGRLGMAPLRGGLDAALLLNGHGLVDNWRRLLVARLRLSNGEWGVDVASSALLEGDWVGVVLEASAGLLDGRGGGKKGGDDERLSSHLINFLELGVVYK